MLKLKALFICLILSVALASCMVTREILFQTSGISDHRKFPSRELKPAAQPFHFIENESARLDLSQKTLTHDNRHQPYDRVLAENSTVAFLVIRHDSVLAEQYYGKYEQEDVVASFSMAKSYTSALVGIAVQEGKITSVEDSMTQYLPELRGKGLHAVTIRHLLQMTSGIHSGEGYLNPFSQVARLYYGRNQKGVTKHLYLDQRPGATFNYVSINTVLLGMIVERVMNQSLTQLLQERIWTPLGMENPASWSIDRKGGMEKAFCCLNATARDFARFGRLYLHKGMWNGQRILDEDWVRRSTTVDARDGAAVYYQYQWWLPSREGDFYAAGLHGQYIYVNPAKELIIVRLGRRDGDVNWPAAFRELARQL